MLEYFDIHNEVQEAIRQSVPVVVMESSIWVQGLPPDDAIHTMVECCRTVREEGAVPIVVGLYRGKIRVGLSVEEIRLMMQNEKCRKVNIRDIPTCLQKREDGATTVSTTIFIAGKLGLPVVATGGIGGVHRDVEKTFDISADLYAIATNPVAVVSSGVKSILNIGATLEVMESMGIPVVGYRTDTFPAFYCSASPFAVPDRMNEVEEIAGMLRIRQKLGMPQGALIANPIPSEYSMSESLMNEMVEKSLMESSDMGLRGKDVTPFLLQRLHKLTNGKTVYANIALIKENSRLAARLSRFLYY